MKITKTSIFPNFLTVSEIIFFGISLSSIEPTTTKILESSTSLFFNSITTSFRRSSFWPCITTQAPCFANSRTASFPIPAEDPKFNKYLIRNQDKIVITCHNYDFSFKFSHLVFFIYLFFALNTQAHQK